jgi:uncharacterized membrane protein
MADAMNDGLRRYNRIESVDLLRGVIMAIMMLDHTRDFVHYAAFAFDPSDVTRTYPLLFFTRWITHFCAPLFVFLAGTSAYFQGMRKSKAELSRFLIVRGVWLIALELLVFRVVITFNMDYAVVLAFLQVIWAIGWSLVALSLLIHLPLRVMVAVSLGMIALHNLLDGIQVTTWNGPGTPVPGFGASLWKILHQPGVIFPLGYPGPAVLVLYPLIPWIGVMGAGYAFGSFYRLDETERRRRFLVLGGLLTLGFLVLRALNIYGDPVPWAHQSVWTKTVISFLALSKYPPSLLYLMMTIGPGILFLGLVDRHSQTRVQADGRVGSAGLHASRRGPTAQVFITYGRVPLFFYLLQWITAHGLALVASRLAGKPTAYLFGNLVFSPPPAPGSGFGLGMVYALWLLGLILLYPLCRWFAGVKARRREWWLSYV